VTAPASLPDAPTLEISGNERGCGGSTGSFNVKQIDRDPVTGYIDAFSASFRQRCDRATDGLHGVVHYRAS